MDENDDASYENRDKDYISDYKDGDDRVKYRGDGGGGDVDVGVNSNQYDDHDNSDDLGDGVQIIIIAIASSLLPFLKVMS